jgi:hypothetical protein
MQKATYLIKASGDDHELLDATLLGLEPVVANEQQSNTDQPG